MKRTIYIAAIILAALLPLHSHAQNNADVGTAISIDPVRIGLNESGDSLNIRLLVAAGGLRVNTDHSLTVNLALTGDGNRTELPPVVYSGKKRYRFDLRSRTVEGVQPENTPYRTFVGIKKNKDYVVDYSVSIPYARWMDGAAITASYTRHDCCIYREAGGRLILADVGRAITEDKYADRDIKPGPALYALMAHWVEPAVKPVMQSGTFQTTFYYPTNDCIFDTSIPQNRQSLDKLGGLFRTISEGSAGITGVTVTGYASPEGPYDRNEVLAMKRSYDISGYLSRNFPMNGVKISNKWVAEDWHALETNISRGNKKYKKDALDVIRNVGIFEGRETALMKLDRGNVYRDLLKTEFPRLRRTELNITVSSQRYTAEEAERMIFENPGAITPDDVFMAASRYDKADKRYRAIYEAAAVLFPGHAVINNNAAAACLAAGDADAAAQYLDRSGNTLGSQVNAGLYHYLQNDIKNARLCFINALKGGDQQAAMNLMLLEELE